MPRGFLYEVGEPDEGLETWREGAVLIHNPHAINKLPAEWLGAGVDERLENGQVVSTFREHFAPFFSTTLNFDSAAPPEMIQKEADQLVAILSATFAEPS
jgi:hypothetical protein